MVAFVTGASSGIGRDIARSLARHGISLILTARRRERLIELKRELVEKYDVKVKIITADLSREKQVFGLYSAVKRYDVDILINNAGFGVFGEFTETDIGRELEMLNVNIRANHILFKLFLRDFKKRDCGFILNTASAAGFFPGPWFSSYYASKAYLVRMTYAVAEELRRNGSHVKVCALCPGPVSTEFSEKAGVRFAIPPVSSEKLAEHAVREMFGGSVLIAENTFRKALLLLGDAFPEGLKAFCTGFVQSKRKRV